MRRLPTRVLTLIAAICVVAVAAQAIALLVVPMQVSPTLLARAVQLCLLVAMARLYPIQLAPKVKVCVDTAPLFAAALVLPLPLAMAIVPIACAIADGRSRAPWFQIAFNTAESMLRVGLTAVVFETVANASDLRNLEPGRWMLGVPLAALTMYLSNVVMMELVIAVHIGRRGLSEMVRRRRESALHEVSLFFLGLLVAGIGVQYPWTLTLLAMPCYVVYRSLRDGIALRLQTLRAMEKVADLVDHRDHYTFEHSRRVGALARAIAHRLGLPGDQIEMIEIAGRLHDLGKIGIKSSVLMKPGRLNDAEWMEMRTHPVVGAEIVAMFPEFSSGRDLIRHHHERYNGGGYPDGLAGDRIPLGARIIAVADSWDAMTSNRAYRDAQELDWVYDELARGRGTQFDPVVLDALLWVLANKPELAIPATATRQDVDVLVPAHAAGA